jgi:pyrroloquinoline-quinone synthase
MPGTVASIDRLLAERHLLKHPFYVAWSKGELPLETLRSYAGQYYHFESNFPRFVGAAYAQLLRPEDRRLLLENMVDEEGRTPTHPELWLDFAEGIGLSRRAARSAVPLGATRALLGCYERQAKLGVGASLASLYAYESIFPEVAAEKSRGLRENYGIRDPATHEFFRVHTGADVEHARAERGVLSHELRRSPVAARKALFAARQTINAWWSFLDAFPVPSAAPGPGK